MRPYISIIAHMVIFVNDDSINSLVLEEFGKFAADTAFVGRTGERVESDAEETQGGDIRMIESGLGQIMNAGDVGGFDKMDDWAASKRQFFEPVGRTEDFLKLAEAGATTAEQDLVREHFGELKLFESDLDAGKPDGEVALDGKHHFVVKVGGDFGRVVDGELIFFSSVKVDIEGFGDLMREAAATDAEHLRSLDTTVVNDGDIGRAATDVHNDAGEIAVKFVAETGAADCERLNGDGEQVKRELSADFLNGGDMDERGEGGIELKDDVGAFEPDGVADFITVDCNRDNGGVNQADFDVRVVGFIGDFFAGLLAGAILNALDDERHFLLGEGFVATLAAVADG